MIRSGMKVAVKDWPRVAFQVVSRRKDKITAVMVGDDRQYVFPLEDVEKLNRKEFCAGCGQIGCNEEFNDLLDEYHPKLVGNSILTK